ncbi:hypothetical protein [Lysobacter gummosus]|uniref:hypothetical protein n=1 Tax=Lysobacter gummosus TaxID=262324 RepID=UPI003629565B
MPPSMIATQELVVPRSMPMILPIDVAPSQCLNVGGGAWCCRPPMLAIWGPVPGSSSARARSPQLLLPWVKPAIHALTAPAAARMRLAIQPSWATTTRAGRSRRSLSSQPFW